MDELKPLLEALLASLRSTSDFAVEQAPLVLREMLWWGAGTAIFWAIFWVFTAWLLQRYVVAPLVKADGNDLLMASLGRGFSLLIAGVGVLANVYVLAKIVLAPRLYLIETLSRAIQGK